MSGRRRYSKRYKRNTPTSSRAQWKGVYGHGQAMPDVLYSKAYATFSSGESWDAFGGPGNIFVNTNDTFMRDLTNNNPNPSPTTAGPHGLMVNNPNLQGSFTRAASTASQGFRTSAIPWQNIAQWAPRYNYCTIYSTDIILEIGNLFTLDAGFNPYGNGEDGYYLYYCLPNVAQPPSAWVDAVNPWGFQRTQRVSDLLKTPGVRRVKLRFPNTMGNESTVKIRIRWKLKDCNPGNSEYMNASVSTSGGVNWTDPIDRTGFDAANKRHLFYFWMGTDTSPSNFNMQARWTCQMYCKFKCWQPRFGVLAPVLGGGGLTFRTQDFIDNPPQEGEEEHPPDEMEYEETSVPSTPVIEQLTRELAQFGNAQKPKIPYKKL